MQAMQSKSIYRLSCAALINTQCSTRNSKRHHRAQRNQSQLRLAVMLPAIQSKAASSVQPSVHALLQRHKRLRRCAFSTCKTKSNTQRLSLRQRLPRSVWRYPTSSVSKSVEHYRGRVCKLYKLRSVSKTKCLSKRHLHNRSKTADSCTVTLKQLVQLRHASAVLRGIVQMVRAQQQCAKCFVEKTLQNFAHQSVPTQNPVEKFNSFALLSALKIRVSMVRFRPRPPNIHRSLAKGYGVFVCASYSASAVL